MPNSVQFYFDCVSPWSYVAFNVIRSLAYIMKYANNQPPVTVPNKGKYMVSELQNAKRMYGLTVKMPETFPFETFVLMGFLYKVKEQFPDKLEGLIERSFNTVWRDGSPLQTVDQVRAMASDAFKNDSDSLSRILEFAASRDARRCLGEEGKSLVGQGAFGFPWIVATRSLDGASMPVFGVDHMENIAAFLHKPYLGPMASGETPRL
ncbi:glutathione transferase [Malassezia obtusa]|uniref:Glutathione transferase n=1 Tax=Malassezia obtusa TaxID=76774 RepID=A0AAF0ITB0_9BASI|nr:glutathione transferase [Malassezia obtusa]